MIKPPIAIRIVSDGPTNFSNSIFRLRLGGKSSYVWYKTLQGFLYPYFVTSPAMIGTMYLMNSENTLCTIGLSGLPISMTKTLPPVLKAFFISLYVRGLSVESRRAYAAATREIELSLMGHLSKIALT